MALNLSLENDSTSCILQFSLINCHFVSIHKEEQNSQKSSFLAYALLKSSFIFQFLLEFDRLRDQESRGISDQKMLIYDLKHLNIFKTFKSTI